MNWIDVAVLALPALPLLSAALIPLLSGGHQRRAARWSIGFTTFTLLVALVLLVLQGVVWLVALLLQNIIKLVKVALGLLALQGAHVMSSINQNKR